MAEERRIGIDPTDLLTLRLRNLIVDREANIAEANKELLRGGWLWDHGQLDREIAAEIDALLKASASLTRAENKADISILMDLDGVMADFVRSACLALGKDPDEMYRTWPPGEYDIAKVFGMETHALWDAVEAQGEDLWANMSTYPWSSTLYGECRKLAPVYFLTKSTLDPRSASGKLKWMQGFLGDRFKARNFLIGPPKHLCGRPQNILIDDSNSNVDSFRKSGGNAILFPQPWNTRHAEANEDRIAVVLSELKELMGGI